MVDRMTCMQLKGSMALPYQPHMLGFDYIVVETTAAAQACVELLCSKNLGVATFMILASHIAYGGEREFRRVVTLDCALFEKSGTMIGGVGKPHGGKMGTSIRAVTVPPDAISDAEKDLSRLAEILDNIRQRVTEAVKLYQTSEKSIAHGEMELAKCHKESEVPAQLFKEATEFLEDGIRTQQR